MSTNVFNRRWATLLLEALTRHGVRHVCLAPGSRSTPLTLSAADHDSLICHTHFDERGLGHLALGLAKSTGAPVAIIVTSGTAAANLYPALIEASLTGERLVLLTADRPPELIDCGANQAIRQPGMFAGYPQFSLDLPRPSPDIPARWLVSALDDAMAQLAQGALHINCPFAEPLYGADDEQAWRDWVQDLGDWWRDDRPWLCATRQLAPQIQHDWPDWREKRGVVLAGRLDARLGERVAQWAGRLGWPLIGDVQSHCGQPLPCADLWLAHPQALQQLQRAEIVVQFGGGLTGKRLLQWQASCRPREYWLVDPLTGRLDPAHHRGRRLVSPIGPWLDLHPPVERAAWATALSDCAGRVQRQAAAGLANGFGEAQLAHRLPQLLAPGGQLFAGNSLSIRLIDALAQLPAGYPVYANRGASGIDGLLSTLAGVQRGNGRPTLAIVGDLSALYDLNALALLRHAPAALVLLVVNNNGGQIFSLLPTPPERREQFYCMPQQVEFGHAAAMFGLNYVRADDWPTTEAAVARSWRDGGVTLLEVTVRPKEGGETLNRLLGQVASW
ncbi:2-succinyl-5-enolpyruvyl-6-hydroxy-3-cyclohexene-1-carboxylic-acid synthase [Affinibrenneria salicis]|uniref:2-succinyl-5-enolpyruvyl-6-hydroxy-3-cyclohexene-1-carboxylate synthase n=1 Tax=Affinibrenneria salicis TaxID=2590031 RepID=A0A5J5G2A5_9GAMM|nr:2-succinyl-5-enolpyruvyl-6-hydroxy-3-cyclohexene-1-carboxylic-acid synthase [Affinibrenneria salicis]KAA9000007.1 2-succinyl-5-enolpyruvyl-6-hydroxy-3-cyclohexene-1-carboxylic-acid synthase [Affinibrenneria salicis]